MTKEDKSKKCPLSKVFRFKKSLERLAWLAQKGDIKYRGDLFTQVSEQDTAEFINKRKDSATRHFVEAIKDPNSLDDGEFGTGELNLISAAYNLLMMAELVLRHENR